MCPHSLKGGIGKRVQKRGPNLWGLKGFLRQPALSANPFMKLLTDVGQALTAIWIFPPSPSLPLADPSLKPQPFLPHPPPSLLPPPVSFCNTPGRASPGWCGWRASKRHLGPNPHLGVLKLFCGVAKTLIREYHQSCAGFCAEKKWCHFWPFLPPGFWEKNGQKKKRAQPWYARKSGNSPL